MNLPAAELPAEAAAEEEYSSPYFATDRARNPACLELRFREGMRKALPYSYIMEISFDPDAGIEIMTAQKRIRITGRNLCRLFDYLISYRVRYIAVNIGTDSTEDGLFVANILIESAM